MKEKSCMTKKSRTLLVRNLGIGIEAKLIVRARVLKERKM